MASSDSCLIHFDAKGPLKTLVKCQKFVDCRSIWLALDIQSRDVARRLLAFVGENVKNPTTDVFDYANFSYHRTCYLALNEIKCGASIRTKM